jgi:hypothetical protein
MNVWRSESWKGIYLEGGRGADRKRAQDITEYLQMRASSAGYLAYDRVVFRRVVKRAKFWQGHANE